MRVHEITIGSLVDQQDQGGPAVAEDFERLSHMMPAALTRVDGSYVWRRKDDAKAEFRAIDGTQVEAAGFSSIDVVGLAVATGSPNVQFNIATGVSSSRRRGESKSTEIVIELAGKGHDDRPLRSTPNNPSVIKKLTICAATRDATSIKLRLSMNL